MLPSMRKLIAAFTGLKQHLQLINTTENISKDDIVILLS